MVEEEIIPRFEQEVPDQPNLFELDANAYAHRFVVVFDREGYSPSLMKRLWENRVACLTYHKYPQGNWQVVNPQYQKVDGEVY